MPVAEAQWRPGVPLSSGSLASLSQSILPVQRFYFILNGTAPIGTSCSAECLSAALVHAWQHMATPASGMP